MSDNKKEYYHSPAEKKLNKGITKAKKKAKGMLGAMWEGAKKGAGFGKYAKPIKDPKVSNTRGFKFGGNKK